MVQNVPQVRVSSIYGYVSAVPAADQVFGCVIEGTKGTPNTPKFISTPQEMAQEFGVEMNAYWGVGGQPLWMTRAIYQGEQDPDTLEYPTPALKAEHYLFSDEVSPVSVIKLIAAREGSYDIHITAGKNLATGNDLVIEEINSPNEYFLGVHDTLTEPTQTAVERLISKINKESYLLAAQFKVVDKSSKAFIRWDVAYDRTTETIAGNDSLATTGRVILGNGSGNTKGTDGEVKLLAEQSTFDLIPDDHAAESHRNALIGLEGQRIAGIFTPRALDAVYGEYAAHVAKMGSPEQHGWRFAIIGAADDASMMDRIRTCIDLDTENIIYVGGGAVDINGVEYSPREATQVVAGKIGYTQYQYAIWGGNASKILAANGINYITDILPMPGTAPDGSASPADIVMYNEHGVLTFQKDPDGIRIREGITTAQNTNQSSEDEIAVVRIIRHAKYAVYDVCYSMLGENIGATFQQDMTNAVNTVLSKMLKEGALIDVPSDGLTAYLTNVQISPRILQREGRVIIDISITPVHAARTIDARITVM
jgi:hypothetical protein